MCQFDDRVRIPTTRLPGGLRPTLRVKQSGRKSLRQLALACDIGMISISRNFGRDKSSPYNGLWLQLTSLLQKRRQVLQHLPNRQVIASQGNKQVIGRIVFLLCVRIEQVFIRNGAYTRSAHRF